MEVISDIQELEIVDDENLRQFIIESSPWLLEEDNDAEIIGYTFILSADDKNLIKKVCINPSATVDSKNHRAVLALDLSFYDEWEYSNYDPETEFYQAVCVVSSVFGANLYMSLEFVKSINGLKERLDNLLPQEGE